MVSNGFGFESLLVGLTSRRSSAAVTGRITLDSLVVKSTNMMRYRMVAIVDDSPDHLIALFLFILPECKILRIPGQPKLFSEIGANLYHDFTPFQSFVIVFYTSVLALCGNDIYPTNQV